MAARPTRLLRQGEVARLLGTSRQNVNNHVAKGNLVRELAHGIPFVTRASLDRYLRRRAAIAKAKRLP